MPSNLVLSNSIQWLRPFLKQLPVDINNQEPAVTTANNVLGVMIAPPMRWRSNRGTMQIALNASSTDYAVTVSDFGFMENDSCWIEDTAGNNYSLQGKIAVPKDTANPNRPKDIAPQYDNNANVITFRVRPKPDQAYTAFLDYQRKLVPLTCFGSSWSPIDDSFEYIFNLGFKAGMAELMNNAYAPIYQKQFIARLLSAQDGLDEQAKLLFLEQFEALTSSLTKNAGRAQASGATRASQ